MRDSGHRDSDLLPLLAAVRLAYLPDREGGWDVRKEWKDVLSGGEKQRISFARILYHEPRFAVIDEGTSAVSADVEGLLYETCKERGITLVTISSRVSLKRYHEWCLDLGEGGEGEGEGEGEQGWRFERVGTEGERGGVTREVERLRELVGKKGEWERRRGEVERELRRVFVEGGEGEGELVRPGYVEEIAEQTVGKDAEERAEA